jgi:hypothetical protein
MEELIKVVSEPSGKTSDEMLRLFNEMITRGELKAYLPERDRQEAVNDTPQETITRTLKGVSLFPQRRIGLSLYSQLFLDHADGTYALHSGSGKESSWGGKEYFSIIHYTLLEKLVVRLNPRDRIPEDTFEQRFSNVFGFSVRKDLVSARLNVGYHMHSKGYRGGSLNVECLPNQEIDSFIKQVCEYARSAEKPAAIPA